MTEAAYLTRTALDAELDPFEARKTALSEAETARRWQDFGLGWELSRLQSAVMTSGWRRLLALHASGRITRTEYLALIPKLSKIGALSQSAD